VLLRDLSETIIFGENFARKVHSKTVILLKGPIGSGKTSFVQGLAKGLSIKDDITSPTFALSHHYSSGKLSLTHMDLYRLNNTLAAQELFLEEYEEIDERGGVLVVEWPELILPVINFYWLIEIEYAEKSGRRYQIFDPKLP
tara:strand:- start:422 stop:847 length:426 start_codon:yes stop_codon:yes gene_type:complete